VPRTAPDPQQFQLAAALHPASRNKRTNTQDKWTAFLSTSFKTLCCTAHCHLSFFPAQVSTGPQTTFSFWRGQNLDVIPKLFPTSFLKTRRQANNPPAGSYRTVILATLTQAFPVQVTTNKSISKNVSFRFSEPRDPSSQECCPNSANPGEQTGAGALFSFGGVVEEFLQM
jgi:hypothetical protein